MGKGAERTEESGRTEVARKKGERIPRRSGFKASKTSRFPEDANRNQQHSSGNRSIPKKLFNASSSLSAATSFNEQPPLVSEKARISAHTSCIFCSCPYWIHRSPLSLFFTQNAKILGFAND